MIVNKDTPTKLHHQVNQGKVAMSNAKADELLSKASYGDRISLTNSSFLIQSTDATLQETSPNFNSLRSLNSSNSSSPKIYANLCGVKRNFSESYNDTLNATIIPFSLPPGTSHHNLSHLPVSISHPHTCRKTNNVAQDQISRFDTVEMLHSSNKASLVALDRQIETIQVNELNQKFKLPQSSFKAKTSSKSYEGDTEQMDTAEKKLNLPKILTPITMKLKQQKKDIDTKASLSTYQSAFSDPLTRPLKSVSPTLSSYGSSSSVNPTTLLATYPRTSHQDPSPKVTLFQAPFHTNTLPKLTRRKIRPCLIETLPASQDDLSREVTFEPNSSSASPFWIGYQIGTQTDTLSCVDSQSNSTDEKSHIERVKLKTRLLSLVEAAVRGRHEYVIVKTKEEASIILVDTKMVESLADHGIQIAVCPTIDEDNDVLDADFNHEQCPHRKKQSNTKIRYKWFEHVDTAVQKLDASVGTPRSTASSKFSEVDSLPHLTESISDHEKKNDGGKTRDKTVAYKQQINVNKTTNISNITNFEIMQSAEAIESCPSMSSSTESLVSTQDIIHVLSPKPVDSESVQIFLPSEIKHAPQQDREARSESKTEPAVVEQSVENGGGKGCRNSTRFDVFKFETSVDKRLSGQKKPDNFNGISVGVQTEVDSSVQGSKISLVRETGHETALALSKREKNVDPSLTPSFVFPLKRETLHNLSTKNDDRLLLLDGSQHIDDCIKCRSKARENQKLEQILSDFENTSDQLNEEGPPAPPNSPATGVKIQESSIRLFDIDVQDIVNKCVLGTGSTKNSHSQEEKAKCQYDQCLGDDVSKSYGHGIVDHVAEKCQASQINEKQTGESVIKNLAATHQKVFHQIPLFRTCLHASLESKDAAEPCCFRIHKRRSKEFKTVQNGRKTFPSKTPICMVLQIEKVQSVDEQQLIRETKGEHNQCWLQSTCEASKEAQSDKYVPDLDELDCEHYSFKSTISRGTKYPCTSVLDDFVATEEPMNQTNKETSSVDQVDIHATPNRTSVEENTKIGSITMSNIHQNSGTKNESNQTVNVESGDAPGQVGKICQWQLKKNETDPKVKGDSCLYKPSQWHNQFDHKDISYNFRNQTYVKNGDCYLSSDCACPGRLDVSHSEPNKEGTRVVTSVTTTSIPVLDTNDIYVPVLSVFTDGTSEIAIQTTEKVIAPRMDRKLRKTGGGHHAFYEFTEPFLPILSFEQNSTDSKNQVKEFAITTLKKRQKSSKESKMFRQESSKRNNEDSDIFGDDNSESEVKVIESVTVKKSPREIKIKRKNIIIDWESTLPAKDGTIRKNSKEYTKRIREDSKHTKKTKTHITATDRKTPFEDVKITNTAPIIVETHVVTVELQSSELKLKDSNLKSTTSSEVKRGSVFDATGFEVSTKSEEKNQQKPFVTSIENQTKLSKPFVIRNAQLKMDGRDNCAYDSSDSGGVEGATLTTTRTSLSKQKSTKQKERLSIHVALDKFGYPVVPSNNIGNCVPILDSFSEISDILPTCSNSATPAVTVGFVATDSSVAQCLPINVDLDDIPIKKKAAETNQYDKSEREKNLKERQSSLNGSDANSQRKETRIPKMVCEKKKKQNKLRTKQPVEEGSFESMISKNDTSKRREVVVEESEIETIENKQTEYKDTQRKISFSDVSSLTSSYWVFDSDMTSEDDNSECQITILTKIETSTLGTPSVIVQQPPDINVTTTTFPKQSQHFGVIQSFDSTLHRKYCNDDYEGDAEVDENCDGTDYEPHRDTKIFCNYGNNIASSYLHSPEVELFETVPNGVQSKSVIVRTSSITQEPASPQLQARYSADMTGKSPLLEPELTQGTLSANNVWINQQSIYKGIVKRLPAKVNLMQEKNKRRISKKLSNKPFNSRFSFTESPFNIQERDTEIITTTTTTTAFDSSVEKVQIISDEAKKQRTKTQSAQVLKEKLRERRKQLLEELLVERKKQLFDQQYEDRDSENNIKLELVKKVLQKHVGKDPENFANKASLKGSTNRYDTGSTKYKNEKTLKKIVNMDKVNNVYPKKGEKEKDDRTQWQMYTDIISIQPPILDKISSDVSSSESLQRTTKSTITTSHKTDPHILIPVHSSPTNIITERLPLKKKMSKNSSGNASPQKIGCYKSQNISIEINPGDAQEGENTMVQNIEGKEEDFNKAPYVGKADSKSTPPSYAFPRVKVCTAEESRVLMKKRKAEQKMKDIKSICRPKARDDATPDVSNVYLEQFIDSFSNLKMKGYNTVTLTETVKSDCGSVPESQEYFHKRASGSPVGSFSNSHVNGNLQTESETQRQPLKKMPNPVETPELYCNLLPSHSATDNSEVGIQSKLPCCPHRSLLSTVVSVQPVESSELSYEAVIENNSVTEQGTGEFEQIELSETSSDTFANEVSTADQKKDFAQDKVRQMKSIEKKKGLPYVATPSVTSETVDTVFTKNFPMSLTVQNKAKLSPRSTFFHPVDRTIEAAEVEPVKIKPIVIEKLSGETVVDTAVRKIRTLSEDQNASRNKTSSVGLNILIGKKELFVRTVCVDLKNDQPYCPHCSHMLKLAPPEIEHSENVIEDIKTTAVRVGKDIMNKTIDDLEDMKLTGPCEKKTRLNVANMMKKTASEKKVSDNKKELLERFERQIIELIEHSLDQLSVAKSSEITKNNVHLQKTENSIKQLKGRILRLIEDMDTEFELQDVQKGMDEDIRANITSGSIQRVNGRMVHRINKLPKQEIELRAVQVIQEKLVENSCLESIFERLKVEISRLVENLLEKETETHDGEAVEEMTTHSVFRENNIDEFLEQLKHKFILFTREVREKPAVERIEETPAAVCDLEETVNQPKCKGINLMKYLLDHKIDTKSIEATLKMDGVNDEVSNSDYIIEQLQRDIFRHKLEFLEPEAVESPIFRPLQSRKLPMSVRSPLGNILSNMTRPTKAPVTSSEKQVVETQIPSCLDPAPSAATSFGVLFQSSASFPDIFPQGTNKPNSVDAGVQTDGVANLMEMYDNCGEIFEMEEIEDVEYAHQDKEYEFEYEDVRGVDGIEHHLAQSELRMKLGPLPSTASDSKYMYYEQLHKANHAHDHHHYHTHLHQHGHQLTTNLNGQLTKSLPQVLLETPSLLKITYPSICKNLSVKRTVLLMSPENNDRRDALYTNRNEEGSYTLSNADGDDDEKPASLAVPINTEFRPELAKHPMMSCFMSSPSIVASAFDSALEKSLNSVPGFRQICSKSHGDLVRSITESSGSEQSDGWNDYGYVDSLPCNDVQDISLTTIPFKIPNDRTGITSDGIRWYDSYNNNKTRLLRVIQIPDGRRVSGFAGNDRMITVLQVFHLSQTDSCLIFDYCSRYGNLWERDVSSKRLVLSAALISQTPVPKELPIPSEYIKHFEKMRLPNHGFLKHLASRIHYNELENGIHGFWWRSGGIGAIREGCFVLINLLKGQMRVLPTNNRTLADGCSCIGRAVAKLCHLESDPGFFKLDRRVHPKIGRFPQFQSDDLRIDSALLSDEVLTFEEARRLVLEWANSDCLSTDNSTYRLRIQGNRRGQIVDCIYSIDLGIAHQKSKCYSLRLQVVYLDIYSVKTSQSYTVLLPPSQAAILSDTKNLTSLRNTGENNIFSKAPATSSDVSLPVMARRHMNHYFLSHTPYLLYHHLFPSYQELLKESLNYQNQYTLVSSTNDRNIEPPGSPNSQVTSRSHANIPQITPSYKSFQMKKNASTVEVINISSLTHPKSLETKHELTERGLRLAYCQAVWFLLKLYDVHVASIKPKGVTMAHKRPAKLVTLISSSGKDGASL